MPKFDKTGPDGKGPKTGKKLGNCDNEQKGSGNGLGRGRGLGNGQGLGNGRGRGQGLGNGR
jgi:hypothetical protein